VVQYRKPRQKKSEGEEKGDILSAADVYELVVGEIGFSRREFLYEVEFWEVQRIVDGYRRRERNSWTIARWQVFCLMHNGIVDLDKIGVRDPEDIVKFPWEKEAAEDMEESDREELKDLLNNTNKGL
jgi:hypothetical protein